MMQVSDAEIDQFAKEHGFAAWYRVSAKEGTQVKMIIMVMMLMMMVVNL